MDAIIKNEKTIHGQFMNRLKNGLSLNNTNGVFMFYIYTDSTDKLNTGYIYNKSVGIISPDIFSNNSKPVIEIICIDNTNLDFVIDIF